MTRIPIHSGNLGFKHRSALKPKGHIITDLLRRDLLGDLMSAAEKVYA